MARHHPKNTQAFGTVEFMQSLNKTHNLEPRGTKCIMPGLRSTALAARDTLAT